MKARVPLKKATQAPLGTSEQQPRASWRCSTCGKVLRVESARLSILCSCGARVTGEQAGHR